MLAAIYTFALCAWAKSTASFISQSRSLCTATKSIRFSHQETASAPYKIVVTFKSTRWASTSGFFNIFLPHLTPFKTSGFYCKTQAQAYWTFGWCALIVIQGSRALLWCVHVPAWFLITSIHEYFATSTKLTELTLRLISIVECPFLLILMKRRTQKRTKTRCA